MLRSKMPVVMGECADVLAEVELWKILVLSKYLSQQASVGFSNIVFVYLLFDFKLLKLA